jgi:hypothetical protein
VDLFKLFIACLLGFALLNYAVIPQAKRRWDANKSLAKISKAGLMAALNFARTFLFIASATYFVLLLIIFLQGLGAGLNTQQLKAAADRVQGYRDGVTAVQKYYATWISLALIVLLTYLAYRREKQYLEDQTAAKLEQEKARLQREAEEGRWESLPPTPEMLEIRAKIQATQAAFDAVDADPQIHPSVKQEQKERLRDHIKALREIWLIADFERRMNLTLDFTGKSGPDSGSQSKFGRSLSFPCGHSAPGSLAGWHQFDRSRSSVAVPASTLERSSGRGKSGGGQKEL